MRWQPFATAPKDGTLILACLVFPKELDLSPFQAAPYDTPPYFAVISCDSDQHIWWNHSSDDEWGEEEPDPTYWQPIDPLPGEEKG